MTFYLHGVQHQITNHLPDLFKTTLYLLQILFVEGVGGVHTFDDLVDISANAANLAGEFFHSRQIQFNNVPFIAICRR